MVKIQDIASSLEEGLDLLSDTYEFTIKPLIGEYETPVDIRKEQLRKKPKIIINGDLLPIPSSIVPVQNLNNVYMSANLQFIVKEEYAKDIYGILCAYVEENVGTAVSFSEYIGIVTFTVPVAGDAGVRPNVGSSVPIMVTVSYQFVKNGLLSNGCKLILDGEELLALTFGISRTRVQQTDNLLAGSEMQSVIGQQGLKISVTMPYTKKDVMVS